MTISLSIGGYRIDLKEPQGHPVVAWPLRPFESFTAAVDDTPADLAVDVDVTSALPPLSNPRLRFDAGKGLWKLFDTDRGLVLESLHTLTHQPRVRAVVSDDYRNVRAWILPEVSAGRIGWCPMHLFNPLIEVCFLTQVARNGGLLLHAAGVSLADQGAVFTGPSGAGKSTIATLCAGRQAFVLSDERVILRWQDNRPMVYGTPWVGSGDYAANASAALTALYVLGHGRDRHSLAALSPSRAISVILQQSFLPRWDRPGMEQTLDLLVSITARVPCRTLAFLKQGDVVDLVMNIDAHASVIGATRE